MLTMSNFQFPDFKVLKVDNWFLAMMSGANNHPDNAIVTSLFKRSLRTGTYHATRSTQETLASDASSS